MKETTRHNQAIALYVLRSVLAAKQGESQAAVTEGKLLDAVRTYGAEPVCLELTAQEQSEMASHAADSWTPSKRANARLYFSTLRAAARGIEREQLANLASMRRCNDPALPSLQSMLRTFGLAATLTKINEDREAALSVSRAEYDPVAINQDKRRYKKLDSAVREMAAASKPKAQRRKRHSQPT